MAGRWLPNSMGTRGALVLLCGTLGVALPLAGACYRWRGEQARPAAFMREQLALRMLFMHALAEPPERWNEPAFAELTRAASLQWVAMLPVEGTPYMSGPCPIPLPEAERLAEQARPDSAVLCRAADGRSYWLSAQRTDRYRVLALVDAAALPERGAGVVFALGALSALCLVLTLAAHHAWVVQPVRQLGERVESTRAGLEGLSVADGPDEIRELVRQVRELQADARHWRAEAANLRHTVEARVDARTRAMERLAARVVREADQDPVTRLNNRRALERELPRMFEEQRRAGRELSMLVIDLDNFKALNDSLGHKAGDEMLAFLGELLRATTRAADFTARFGGDEFIVLLPDCGLQPAVELGRRLNTMFAQRARLLEGVTAAPGLSIGIAALQHDTVRDADDMLRLADETMYAAKRAGGGVLTHAEAAAHGAKPSAATFAQKQR